jgi:hypothetical protein
MGQDSSVGIATRYELGRQGTECRWGGAKFSVPVQTRPGANPASYYGYRGIPGGKPSDEWR